jgi:hypothetical protein
MSLFEADTKREQVTLHVNQINQKILNGRNRRTGQDIKNRHSSTSDRGLAHTSHRFFLLSAMKNPYVLANQDDATPIKKKKKKKPDTSLSPEVGERYIYSFVFAQYLT